MSERDVLFLTTFINIEPVAVIFMKNLFTFSILFIFFSQISMAGNDPAVGITVSFPWVNSYRYVDYRVRATNTKTGFFGLGIAAYYKKNEHKVSLNFGFIQDLDSPIGAIDYSKLGTKTHIGAGFGELIYHHPVYRNLNVIAGLNFTSYKYEFTSFVDTVPGYIKTDNTLGISVGFEYRFNKFISAATIYRPSIASFETDGIYRHIISWDIRIDIDMKRKKVKVD